MPNVPWCADNGCFGKGYPGDDAWYDWLSTAVGFDGAHCRFAVVPDVVGDADATLSRSRPWLRPVADLGVPVAYVGQDGLNPLLVPWDHIDVFFLGGSTEWKLGRGAAYAARIALGLGKWVHMGRVNSRKRLRYAHELGCQSADGTFLVFGPDVNLPKLLGWLEELEGN